jgi:hypothetical protein
MLTKSDIEILGKLIEEKVRPIVREEIKIEIAPIRKQLQVIKRRLTTVEKDVSYILRTHDEDAYSCGST